MLSRISIYRETDPAVCFSPFRNLAVEKYLTFHVREEECILYLWQNRRTVVIGKNQNPWKECRIDELNRDGGYLVRRLSGGGAVYHDLGNLNFTFCARKANYDVPRQLEVILRAVRALGAPAEKTGRNDLTCEGRKFSGNAFFSSGDFCCHHGTLMMDVDSGALSRYLAVSPEKLQGKGVDSVRSRVTSLKEICGKADIGILKEEIIKSCEETLKTEAKTDLIIDPEALRKEEERFSSDAWTYGKNPPFDLFLENRFTWGGIRLEFRIKAGRIADLTVWTDAMDTEIAGRLKETLCGCVFSPSFMYEALQKCGKEEYRDIAAWILNQEV